MDRMTTEYLVFDSPLQIKKKMVEIYFSLVPVCSFKDRPRGTTLKIDSWNKLNLWI